MGEAYPSVKAGEIALDSVLLCYSLICPKASDLAPTNPVLLILTRRF